MSRYAKTPIALPGGVELKKTGDHLVVKGPKGQLELDLQKGIEIEVAEGVVNIALEEGSKQTSAVHGLHRSLISNMIEGVSKGFVKKLNLIGVGYRAAVAGNMLDLQLGFSHPTKLEIPSSLQVAVEKTTTISVQGIDKQEVGQFAAAIRAIRPPEPYKGKGVRYEGEYVRKKAGKAAKGK